MRRNPEITEAELYERVEVLEDSLVLHKEALLLAMKDLQGDGDAEAGARQYIEQALKRRMEKTL